MLSTSCKFSFYCGTLIRVLEYNKIECIYIKKTMFLNLQMCRLGLMCGELLLLTDHVINLVTYKWNDDTLYRSLKPEEQVIEQDVH